MRVGIATGHGGFGLKEELVKRLRAERRRNLGAKILATAARLAWISTVDNKRTVVLACEKGNVVFVSAITKFVLDLARIFLLQSLPMTLALGFATVG